MRESRFLAEIIQELVKDQLIQSGAKHSGDDPDRYLIEEILPAGLAFISQQHPFRDRHNVLT